MQLVSWATNRLALDGKHVWLKGIVVLWITLPSVPVYHSHQTDAVKVEDVQGDDGMVYYLSVSGHSDFKELEHVVVKSY